MDETAIHLKPCESGYQVFIGDRLIGTLIERVWERGGQVADGVLAVPWDMNSASHRYPTVGRALDCLLSIDRRVSAELV